MVCKGLWHVGIEEPLWSEKLSPIPYNYQNPRAKLHRAQECDRLKLAPILNPKCNGLITPEMFPEVTVINFYGSNITSVVGAVLQNFTKGHLIRIQFDVSLDLANPFGLFLNALCLLIVDLFTELGYINQEKIDSESNKIWDLDVVLLLRTWNFPT